VLGEGARRRTLEKGGKNRVVTVKTVVACSNMEKKEQAEPETATPEGTTLERSN